MERNGLEAGTLRRITHADAIDTGSAPVGIDLADVDTSSRSRGSTRHVSMDRAHHGADASAKGRRLS
jgi:hypothetical protein